MTERLLPGLRRPDEEERLQSCERKTKYPSLEEAERQAHMWSVEKGEAIEAYECRFCDGAHIGHALGARAIRRRMGLA